MKKSLTTVAVAASAMMASMVTQAAPTDLVKVYGTVHSSLDREVESNDTRYSIDSSSRRGWALGAKGSADAAGSGLQVIYKFEVGFDGSKNVATGAADTDADGKADAITDSSPGHFYLRDSWVGVIGSFGKIRMGTMATFYKSTGAMIDPLFTTALEGRDNKLGMMSSQHAGNGVGKGRGSDMISFDSPTISKIFRFNAHIQPRGDSWNYGGGAKLQVGPATLFGSVTTDEIGDLAMKAGAKLVFGPASLGGHYERGDALGGKQYGFVSAAYQITKELQLAANAGYELDSSDFGGAGAIQYQLAKASTAYFGYGRNLLGSGSAGTSYTVTTLGLKHKF